MAPPIQADPIFLVSGGVPVSDGFTIIVQIPPNVKADSGQLSIRNIDTSATMYFKWVKLGDSTTFAIGDAGIVLPPGNGWDTRLVPPGRSLIGRSSVNGAICALDVSALLKTK